MPENVSSIEPKRRGRLVPVLVIAITLVVFGATLTVVSLQLRGTLRAQIAGRDARILNNMAAFLPFSARGPNASPDQVGTECTVADERGMPDPDLGIPLEPADREVEALLQSERLRETTSRLKGLLASGVIAVELFEPDGRILMPVDSAARDIRLQPEQIEALQRFQPVSIYRPRVRFEEVYGPAAASAAVLVSLPVLEVLIPLRSLDGTKLVGINRILLDGSSIASEFSTLDTNLAFQGAVVFCMGGLVITVALVWAFKRLERANRLLTERTASLVKANTDLARSARAAAVGAVTAHLLHGLKNPVAGLQQYLSTSGEGPDGGDGDLRAEAANITRRMQTMIHEIARVLREENGPAAYEVTLEELQKILSGKAAAVARDRGVHVRFARGADCSLSNHQANLVLLILENLVTNAIQATPPGKSVTVTMSCRSTAVDFEIRDEGNGVPPEMKTRLFTPIRSTKPDGLGMGLAISKQLADHLGAELELRSSSQQGAVFGLLIRLVSQP